MGAWPEVTDTLFLPDIPPLVSISKALFRVEASWGVNMKKTCYRWSQKLAEVQEPFD